MSAVFEFDDDDNLRPLRRDSTTTNNSISLVELTLDSVTKELANSMKDELPSFTNTVTASTIMTGPPQQIESGYSSEVDAPEPTLIQPNETTYEVELGRKSFISSSVTTGDIQTMKKKRKVSLDDFDIIKLLGRGAYGKVMLCRHIESGQLYAMKVLKKASLMVHTKNAEHTKAERQILEEVRNPFIVQLMYAFQTNDRLYLILEYAPGGELFTHMATEYMFSEDVARFYLAELVLALEHIHSLGIVYRDLKPENCLLDAEGHVVLTDFGLSKVSLDGRTSTICGTAEYMAPEILMEMAYDNSVDWWTLGILMFEMLTGYTPFRSANKKKTLDAIQKKKLQLPYFLSNDAKDLLTRLLRKNPNVRLGNGKDGIRRIKSHGFFRKVDWQKLKARELTPPILPVVTDPILAENFDAKFTDEIIKDTPIDSLTTLDTEMQAYFKNFSYVGRSYLDDQLCKQSNDP
ncbi:kinase-like domain-containing protein [Halteromyces radiatus]|uniref:kinase-like domain-containing protein n=1 Tax=Halteromyces radiatus TaxID=101107 RepID=UPI00221E595F|nr:kinase-like domain-containing protein [Halteromyces radiatus]KAI8100028.1 kinase-like domain-containing protein [Halteromyces radiatus]